MNQVTQITIKSSLNFKKDHLKSIEETIKDYETYLQELRVQWDQINDDIECLTEDLGSDPQETEEG